MKDIILSILTILAIALVGAGFCWLMWILVHSFVFEPILKFLYIFAGGAALS